MKKKLVILHLYHLHLLDEISSYIMNIRKYEHDIYVSVPIGTDIEFKNKIKEKLDNCTVVELPNKGTDNGPFIDVINSIELEPYDIIFKVHGKNSNTQQRIDLFESILGNESTVDTVIDILNAGKHNMVGSKKHPCQEMCGSVTNINNGIYYKEFCDRFGYTDYNLELFVAGTMFACTVDIVKEIKSKNISIEEFELGYAPDGLKSHAFERLYGKIVKELGSSIYWI